MSSHRSLNLRPAVYQGFANLNTVASLDIIQQSFIYKLSEFKTNFRRSRQQIMQLVYQSTKFNNFIELFNNSFLL